MSVSGSEILAPIVVTRTGGDIGTVIGVSDPDIGDLLVHNNVKMMAKCKAFCYDAAYFASDAAREAARIARNCGLTIRQYSDLTTMMNAGVAVAVGAYAWVYDKPRGRAYGEYGRTLDMKGYNHDVYTPWRYGVTPNPCYALDTPMVSDAGGAGIADITLADLAGDGSNGRTTNYKYYNLSGMNLGVAIREVGDTGLPQARTFSDGQTFAPPTSLLTGDKNFDVVTFLTNQSASDWTTQMGNGKYYLAPMPHTVWEYHATTGLSIRASVHPLFGDIYIKSLGQSRYYYKIQLYVGSYLALDETTSGTITGTESHWHVLNLSGTPWTGNETYILKYYTDHNHSIDQQIYPTYDPS